MILFQRAKEVHLVKHLQSNLQEARTASMMLIFKWGWNQLCMSKVYNLQLENQEDMPYPFLVSCYFLLLESRWKGQSILNLTEGSYLSCFCICRISQDSEYPRLSKLSASCWKATTLFPAASNWCRNVSYLAQSCFRRENKNKEKTPFECSFFPNIPAHQNTAIKHVISW